MREYARRKRQDGLFQLSSREKRRKRKRNGGHFARRAGLYGAPSLAHCLNMERARAPRGRDLPIKVHLERVRVCSWHRDKAIRETHLPSFGPMLLKSLTREMNVFAPSPASEPCAQFYDVFYSQRGSCLCATTCAMSSQRRHNLASSRAASECSNATHSRISGASTPAKGGCGSWQPWRPRTFAHVHPCGENGKPTAERAGLHASHRGVANNNSVSDGKYF